MTQPSRHARLINARLYVLTDGAANEAEFETRIAQFIAASVDVVQLRDKSLDDRTLLRRAMILARQSRGSETLSIINDRTDIALASNAHGVHLGQDDLPIDTVRNITPPNFLIGVSTHSPQQALDAERSGADYIGVGPTFPSQTKAFSAFTGVELLRAVASTIDIPAFAIGGITVDRIPDVLQMGIRRVAVANAICGADYPVRAIEQFQAALRNEDAG